MHWPEKAQKAHLLAGRKAEWQDYFTRLKVIYARRPLPQKELAKL
jgi:hypothetical protein